MMNKIINDQQCLLDLALCLALNAKNILQNTAGISSFQLVLGREPKLLLSLSDKLLVLSMKPCSEVLQDNLSVVNSAGKVFHNFRNK